MQKHCFWTKCQTSNTNKTISLQLTLLSYFNTLNLLKSIICSTISFITCHYISNHWSHDFIYISLLCAYLSSAHNAQYQLLSPISFNFFWVIFKHLKWNQALQPSHPILLSWNALSSSSSLHSVWNIGHLFPDEVLLSKHSAYMWSFVSETLYSIHCWLQYPLLTKSYLYLVFKPVIVLSHNFNAFTMEFVTKLLNAVFWTL